jgi:hypothetical protein
VPTSYRFAQWWLALPDGVIFFHVLLIKFIAIGLYIKAVVGLLWLALPEGVFFHVFLIAFMHSHRLI